MPKIPYPDIKFTLKRTLPFLSVERLTKNKKELEEQLKKVHQSSPAEGGSRSLDAESLDESEEKTNLARVSAITSLLQRTLRGIKISLKKVKHGSYGICDRCGEKIDPARLKAMPDARFCLECAKIVEEKQGE